jgi:hypothetical protein
MLNPRKYPRVSFTATVVIFSGSTQFQGEAKEIGAGGMSIRCLAGISISQPVELEFSLSGGPSLRLPAILWWKKDGYMGFRFDPSSGIRQEIELWVHGRIGQAQYFSKPI